MIARRRDGVVEHNKNRFPAKYLIKRTREVRGAHRGFNFFPKLGFFIFYFLYKTNVWCVKITMTLVFIKCFKCKNGIFSKQL